MNQQRITTLYLQPAPLFGGAERQASIGASLLPKFGIDVILVFGPGTLIENWIDQRGVKQAIQTKNFPGGWPTQRGLWTLSLPLRYWVCGVRAYREIITKVKQNRVDVIVASLGFSWVVGTLVARKMGIPIVWRAGGARINVIQKAALWAVSRFLRPDALLCVSEAVRDTIAPLVMPRNGRKATSARSLVVLNGVDHAVFHVGAGNPRRYRPPDAAFVVGCAGRLTRGKHPEDFLELAARMQLPHPEVRFLLGGDGARRQELETLARERGLDNLQFLGFVEDMPSFFAACDVAVLPSAEEGCPNFALEAMAMGVPLVAADISATSEVTHGNRNAILYSLGSVDELTESVTLLMSSPELLHSYRKKGLNWVRQFDVETSTAAVAALLLSLASARRARASRAMQAPPRRLKTGLAAPSLELRSHISSQRILERDPPDTG